MAWRIGIDIGGTFTDLVAADLDSGELYLRKVPSTPANLAEGAAVGLQALAESVPVEHVSFLAHGTTAGTNALIEGKGARTGLVTTRGFRDLLEIARQQRPSLYDLSARKPAPLVPRSLRREVHERLRFDGTAAHALDRDEVKRELEGLGRAGVEALAICFLHSYINPDHERAVRDLAKTILPDVYVSASCDLLPRFREYERLSTTVVNAYLGPLMNRYLDDLGRRIGEAGVRALPHIMQSNGGLIPLGTARGTPASTVLSGPAAGAAAAALVCEQLGVERAIALDMGGTSTDICLIEAGLPAAASGREVGGYAVELPGVDVRCIGAGGGSILWIDPGGLPQVGPRSAGADPGPVCYGRGGEEPTLTDAFAVLGRVGAEGLLGGEMPLDVEGARRGVGAGFAKPLGMDLEPAALGAVELAVANVRRAVEGITVAEGRDPRDFVLVAAGGAGPLIACEVASELGLPEVIVPPCPGDFSACGLLASDLRRDWVKTRLIAASRHHLLELASGLRELEDAAREWVAETGPADARWLLVRHLSARYVGQDYELQVPVPSGELSEDELDRLVASFHAAHQDHYGYALGKWPVEFVDVRVSAVGGMPLSGEWREHGGRGRSVPRDKRLIFVSRAVGMRECAIRARDELQPGDILDGPAAVQQYDATTYLPQGWRARLDAAGNLRIAREVAR